MRLAISVANVHAGLAFLGSRHVARQLREQVESLLQKAQEVEIDFYGVNISQSFADELVGVLILQHTPDVLKRVIFKGCSESVKAILAFVVADRHDEFVRMQSH